MRQHAFLTGGTGFIGINLAQQLIENEWAVTALHRKTSDLTELQKLPVNLVEGSITDLNSLKQAIPPEANVVFHLAGDTNLWSQNNDRQTAINVSGTENMIVASKEKNIQTFIHTSSVAAWGSMPETISEETPQKGYKSWVNYERTKWAGERKALKGIDYDMKVVILNPAMVVGPHDANNWGRLFFALRDGELPGVTRGNMSVGHVREVAKAHIAAVNKGRNGERYILGGKNCEFADFVSLMAYVSGISHIPKTIPEPILKMAAYISSAKAFFTGTEPDLTPELAKLMTRSMSYSSQKAKKELGYRIPPIEESIQDCYRWLKQQGLL